MVQITESLHNRKVFVTGGAGFIGKYLVAELNKLGADVTLIDLPQRDFLQIPAGINIIKGDLLNAETYKTELLSTEYVYHLAAKTDLSGRTIDDYSVNFEGTKILLEILKNSQLLKRFVFFQLNWWSVYSLPPNSLTHTHHIEQRHCTANRKYWQINLLLILERNFPSHTQ